MRDAARAREEFKRTEWGSRDRPTPRRPLVGIALLFLAGILVGFFSEVSAAGVAGLTAILALVALGARKRSGRIALFLAVFFAGWTRSALLPERVSPLSVERRMGRPEAFARMSGVIVDDPSIRLATSGPGIQRFRLRVEAIMGERWERARGTVDVSMPYSPDEALQYGDRISISGRLTLGAPGRRPRLRADGRSIRRLEQNRGNPLQAAALAFRHRAARTLRLGLENSPEAAAVQTALMLGIRDDFPDDLHQAFQVTGTFHIFAISGLHVGILCVLWVIPLQLAGWPRTRW
ncbi:MAG: ComEC/Rec2 family competence protein, partial [Kiritimatiellia bacterium]|nr:ComEC/Rec2 family competence protein [Kiritimatiellia bacterium]